MAVEKFDRKKHLPMLDEWYRARKLLRGDRTDPSLYPDTGFVVDGIVAGFLYVTNSSMAFIDGTVADPKSTREERHAAIHKLLEALLNEARRNSAHAVCTYVYQDTLRNFLAANEFHAIDQPHHVFVRRM